MIDHLNLQDKESNNSFGKEYKLCSKRVIDELFNNGKTIKQYPLRLLFIKNPLHSAEKVRFQIVISVPKKKIKKAHDRNTVKRILRELIRKNKQELEKMLEIKNCKIALFLIYSETSILEYSLLEKKTIKLFQQLQNTINNENA